MFKQLIKDGYQAEVPDIWLTEGNPWEVKRNDIQFEVAFSGKTTTDKGKTTWIPGERVSEGVRGVCGEVTGDYGVKEQQEGLAGGGGSVEGGGGGRL